MLVQKLVLVGTVAYPYQSIIDMLILDVLIKLDVGEELLIESPLFIVIVPLLVQPLGTFVPAKLLYNENTLVPLSYCPYVDVNCGAIPIPDVPALDKKLALEDPIPKYIVVLEFAAIPLTSLTQTVSVGDVYDSIHAGTIVPDAVKNSKLDCGVDVLKTS